MAEEKSVRIVKWPPEAMSLGHRFDPAQPAPVTVRFEPVPANVVVSTSKPVDVDMNMHLWARQSIPFCIRLCEPLCVKSDYRIGIRLFDQPIISISVRGMTRLYNCAEDH